MDGFQIRFDLQAAKSYYIDVLEITVNANRAPTLSAGSDATTSVGTTVSLTGSSSDDAHPTTAGSVTLTWSMVSGPGGVTFGDSSSATSTALFDTAKTYVLQLQADDGDVVVVDTVVYTVIPAGPSLIITESSASTDVVEGGATDTYTISLRVAPDVDVTVTPNPDGEVAVSPTSFTFTSGDWSVAQVVTVNAVDDADDEGVHAGFIGHTVTSGNASYNGLVTGNVLPTITDNDSPGTLAMASSAFSVSEGAGVATITVERSGGSAGVASVNVSTANGTATAGSDYTAIASSTHNWADGEGGSKTVDVTLNDDSDIEGSETFTTSLSGASGASLGSPTSTTVTIADNEEKIFLINFSDDESYSTDGTNTWQTFDFSSTEEGGGNGDAVAISATTLKDKAGNSDDNYTFALDVSGVSGTENIGLQTGTAVLQSFFSASPYSWFDDSDHEQRETYSLKNGSGIFKVVLDGFSSSDNLTVEFVLARPGTGDRATTSPTKAPVTFSTMPRSTKMGPLPGLSTHPSLA